MESLLAGLPALDWALFHSDHKSRLIQQQSLQRGKRGSRLGEVTVGDKNLPSGIHYIQPVVLMALPMTPVLLFV